jgi:hypothetical protein
VLADKGRREFFSDESDVHCRSPPKKAVTYLLTYFIYYLNYLIIIIILLVIIIIIFHRVFGRFVTRGAKKNAINKMHKVLPQPPKKALTYSRHPPPVGAGTQLYLPWPMAPLPVTLCAEWCVERAWLAGRLWLIAQLARWSLAQLSAVRACVGSSCLFKPCP